VFGDRPSRLKYLADSKALLTLQTTCPAMSVVGRLVRNLYSLVFLYGMLVTRDLMRTFANHLNDFSGYSQVFAYTSEFRPIFFFGTSVLASVTSLRSLRITWWRLRLHAICPRRGHPTFIHCTAHVIAYAVPHYCPISLGIAQSLLLLLDRFS
jgi:hypothetical protein